MATPARVKRPRPYAVVFRHTKADPLPPSIDRLVEDAAATFRYTTGLVDGTRSNLIVSWADVLTRAVGRYDAAAAKAYADRLDEQVAQAQSFGSGVVFGA